MFEYLLSLSLLIAALLVIRGIFRKTVSPRAIYALWLVVLIRMLVPITLFEIDVTVPEFLKSNNTEQVGHSEEGPGDSGTVTDVQEQLPTTLPVQTTPTYPAQSTSPVTPVCPSVTTPATPGIADTEINIPVITPDPMEDERDFITVAGIYGKDAEPRYPDGAIIHAGNDGTLYYVSLDHL